MNENSVSLVLIFIRDRVKHKLNRPASVEGRGRGFWGGLGDSKKTPLV